MERATETENNKKLEALAKNLESLEPYIERLDEANRLMLECLQRIASGKTKDARIDAHATILSLIMVSVN